MPKIENAVLLHDADIFAYRAAAATDGRQYTVSWFVNSGGLGMPELNQQHLKYKKDADLRAAEVGGSVELSYIPEPESHAFHIITNSIKQVPIDLLGRVDVIGTEHFLTAKGSFREVMDPSYKENRKILRRPKNLKACKEFITKKYGATCRSGELEADDLLGIRMTALQAEGKNPICVSIDKDLKQVPGWHWDFVKKQLILVSEVDGLRSFYRQLLTGDTTDGIIGIKGMGPKTAAKLIDHLISPFDMYVACLREWLQYLKQDAGEDPMVYMLRVVAHVKNNARLLYLLRKEGEHWEEPDEEGA